MSLQENWIVFDTPEEYLEFFDKIPEENWCENRFIDKSTGKMCAIGHLTGGARDGVCFGEHPFRGLLRGVLPYEDASSVNNGTDQFEELGSTPKERIINALILKCAGLWEEACGG